ncbi:hypothetical protein L4C34_12985 [Vibrio profundum]|uniref:hypothetical protein n=1 Tax=Vibrio profundum TaxID=2910247 RepID=UPI003D103455
MSYQKNAHGTFEIDTSFVHEGIIVGKLIGAWNIQTAEEYIDAWLEIAELNLMQSEWGGINDMRQWGLCTPEVSTFFNDNILKFVDIGFIFNAVLPSIEMQKMITKRIADVAQETTLETQYFSSFDTALSWARAELRQYD